MSPARFSAHTLSTHGLMSSGTPGLIGPGPGELLSQPANLDGNWRSGGVFTLLGVKLPPLKEGKGNCSVGG